MRRHGHVDGASGIGLHGHACWSYGSDEELRGGIVQFLADGVRLGQRLLYVGPVDGGGLPEQLDGLSGAEALRERGALEVVAFEHVYDPEAPESAETRLATYAAATERALADGYTGLRVAATVTAEACETADWDEHTRWESVAERYMARHPMAALCCYDRRVVPEHVLADLCHLHPMTHAPPGLAGFRLFAQPDDATAVAGEVDCFSASDFRRLLDTTAPAGEERVLDLRGLEFADHHAVLALAEHTRQLSDRGAKVLVRNVPYEVRRISELLDVALSPAHA